MKTYIKHLIECTCILPQYKNMANPIFHKFIVFSIINENDEVEEKIVQCPNCHITHKVIEIGKSEFINKENLSSIKTKEDIAVGLPSNISGILESHNCDLPTFEEVEFILDNKLWGKEVLISKELIEDHTIGKIMIIKDENRIKMESFTREEYIK